jgi:hypothetical protein
MTIYKIKSAVLHTEGHKVQSIDRAYVARRLAEIRERDPQAKMLKMEATR